jgi:hypothetical protein
MNEDGWMMCVGVCWCVWSVCVWWPRQCFVVVFFATCHRRKWCHFLTWRIWHVDFGHRNLDNFSQLEIGHCWDWCWSLILWVWLSVIECDWVCKLTFCNRCASRNASAKCVCVVCLCVCVFVCFQNDQCFKMIKIYASNHCDICNYLSDSNLIPQLKMIIQCMSLCVQCRIVLSDDCDLIFNLQVFRNE